MTSRPLLSLFATCYAISVFSSASAQLRIMPLGDSLTSGVDGTDSTGTGGYRAQLERRLITAGIPFDFVGRQQAEEGGGGGALGDPDHEGWGGYNLNGDPPGTDNFSLRARIKQSQPVAQTQPDVVLVMAGSNNVVWTAAPLGSLPKEQAIASDINALYDEIYAQRPQVTIIGATIPPTNPNSEKARAPRSKIVAFNKILEDNIAARKADGARIELCDIFSSITAPTSDINLRTPLPDVSTGQSPVDGVHPNSSGYRKMGDHWFQSLQEFYWTVYPLYKDSETLGEGWRRSPSYGDFYDGDAHTEGWRFHKNLGWFWGAEARKTTHLWMWSPGYGWIYSSEDTWPSIYRQLNGEWYFVDEDNTYRVFRYARDEWVQIPN